MIVANKTGNWLFTVVPITIYITIYVYNNLTAISPNYTNITWLTNIVLNTCSLRQIKPLIKTSQAAFNKPVSTA